MRYGGRASREPPARLGLRPCQVDGVPEAETGGGLDGHLNRTGAPVCASIPPALVVRGAGRQASRRRRGLVPASTAAPKPLQTRCPFTAGTPERRHEATGRFSCAVNMRGSARQEAAGHALDAADALSGPLTRRWRPRACEACPTRSSMVGGHPLLQRVDLPGSWGGERSVAGLIPPRQRPTGRCAAFGTPRASKPLDGVPPTTQSEAVTFKKVPRRQGHPAAHQAM